jgi:hypothetical protein
MVVRRKAFEDVGLLDESFFMYWEDADLCRRAKSRGWRVAMMPRCEVRHFGGGNSATALVPLKMMKEENEFIYSLTDPNRTMAQNVLLSMRLMVTKLNSKSFGADIFKRATNGMRVIGSCLTNTNKVMRKWRADRHVLEVPLSGNQISRIRNDK